MSTVINQRMEELSNAFLAAKTDQEREAITNTAKAIKMFSDALHSADGTRQATKLVKTVKASGKKHYELSEVTQLNVGDTVQFQYAQYSESGDRPAKELVEAVFLGMICRELNGRKVQYTALEVCDTVQDLNRGHIYGFDVGKLANFTIFGKM